MTMATADWDAMRSAPSLAPASGSFSADNRFHLGADKGDWRPRPDAGLAVAQLPWRDGKESLNIGVSEVGPDRRRVYLFRHQL